MKPTCLVKIDTQEPHFSEKVISLCFVSPQHGAFNAWECNLSNEDISALLNVREAKDLVKEEHIVKIANIQGNTKI